MVGVTPELTSIRNLYDKSLHDVSVIIDKSKVELRPGQEVAIVNGPRAKVRDRVYDDSVARRDLQVVSLNQDKHVAVSDFSHVNLMACNSILRSIKNSGKDENKKLFGKLEKMAAVLTTVRDRTRAPYVVPYEPITSERVAAKEKPGM